MPFGLTQNLHRAVRQHPDRLATVSGERRQTYAQFTDRVARLAGALRQLGVRRGDRVGVLALNSDRYLEAAHAAFWLGAALNPANIRWSAAELAYSFDDCETGVLFIDATFLPILPTLRDQCKALREVVYIDDGERPPGVHSAEELIAASEAADDVGAAGDDLAGVFYTGGTTGRPKGVKLSHHNLIGGAVGRLIAAPPTGQVFLHTAPLFHIAGLLGALWHMTIGGTHVLLPSFSAPSFMQLVQRERVTDTILVPAMIQMLIDHPGLADHDLSSLRMLNYGGAPISEALLTRVRTALPGAQLLQAYGMTELAGPVTFLTPEDHSSESQAQGRLRSAGRTSTVSEIRIVDERGAELPRGQTGEIVARGMNVMLGYWNRPQEQERALRDGWMHTGDAGVLDKDGYLFVVDRVKDMIVTGGENVYSAEVENALASHPAVAQCAVVGIPSERWGEAVHAIVVLRAGATTSNDELLSHCKKQIAGYKCPQSFQFEPQLPLSGAGKVLKVLLREPYWRGRERKIN